MNLLKCTAVALVLLITYSANSKTPDVEFGGEDQMFCLSKNETIISY